jgi:non-homologous end joining protein Ku
MSFAIDRKVQGKEISVAEAPEHAGRSNVIDLMDALKASLQGQKKSGAADERKGPKRAAPSAAGMRKARRHKQ